MKSSFAAMTAAAAMSGLCAACVVTPTHEQMHSAVMDPVSFSTYATQAGATLTVQCGKPAHSVVWQNAGTLNANSTPITLDGESVYAASGNITLPASCWDTGWAGATYHTYIQIKQGTNKLYVYDNDGLDCLGEALADGDGPITAGYSCALVSPYTGQKQTYLALRSNSYW